MTTGKPTPSEVPYQEITDDRYAQKAALTFAIEEPRAGLRVLRGRCPRCDALIDIPVMPSVFEGMRSFGDLLRRGPRKGNGADTIEPVLCTCDDEHPNRPEGRKGCGAYWNFVIRAASA